MDVPEKEQKNNTAPTMLHNHGRWNPIETCILGTCAERSNHSSLYTRPEDARFLAVSRHLPSPLPPFSLESPPPRKHPGEWRGEAKGRGVCGFLRHANKDGAFCLYA